MNKKTLNLSIIFFLCLVQAAAAIKIEYSSFQQTGNSYTGKQHTEDRVVVKKIDDEDGIFAAVFDGRWGSEVARSAGLCLYNFLVPYLADKNDPKVIMDELKRGIVNFDVDLYKKRAGTSAGSSIFFIYIPKNSNLCYCVSLGDSDATLYSENKRSMLLSVDHTLTPHSSTEPITEEEARVQRAGGRVDGQGRINSVLTASRGLGYCTLGLKIVSKLEMIESGTPVENFPNHPVSNIPDVRCVPLEQDDKFIVIGSVGLWNVMSQDAVEKFISEKIKSGGDIEKIAKELSSTVEEEWKQLKSTDDSAVKDDVSAIVIRLSDIQKEEFSSPQKLNKTLTFNQVCLIGGAGAVAVTGIWNWKRISKWWNNLGKNKNKDK